MAKKLSREFKATVSLLQRSGFSPHASLFNISRGIHTSAARYQERPQNDGNKKPDNEDDKKIPSVVTKALLWMLSGYMFIALLSLLFPSSNQPEVSSFKFVVKLNLKQFYNSPRLTFQTN